MTQPTIEQALKRLADAADAVGVKHFDTDDLGAEVEELIAATEAARAALAEKQGLPETTSSKSDAQIADELQQSMDALLEPDDEGDKIKYRTLIRIMARARNRLRQVDAALSAQREGE